MIRSMTVTLLSIFVLAGCARQTMVFNGKTYTDMAEYTRDVHSDWDSTLASITPLPHPVSDRRLIILYPSRSYYQQARLNLVRQMSPSATIDQLEKNVNFYIQYDMYTMMPRNVARKGIFPKVETVLADGADQVQPTGDYDVLVLTLASTQSSKDQWYYYSKRNGKQAISMDMGARTTAERNASILDSIKVAALQ